MRKLKVGILGQGRSGRNIHAASLERPGLRERFVIAAVADREPERCRESVAGNPGCRMYGDYRELLAVNDLDLMINALPSHAHVPVSIAALRAGHHVLCEKPLTRFPEEMAELKAAIAASGRFFAVFQQSRFAPTFRRVQSVIASGVLGRIMTVKLAFTGFGRRWDWQTLQEYGGGNLVNTGPHPIDQALQLYGDAMPEEIFCRLDNANSLGGAEDHVKLLLSGKGHPAVDIEISNASLFDPYVYLVYGTHGTLWGNHRDIEWRYFDPQEAPAHAVIAEPMPERNYCSENLSFYSEKWSSSEEGMSFNSRVEKFYLNLYDAMTGKAPLEVTLPQVERQVALFAECYRQNPEFGHWRSFEE